MNATIGQKDFYKSPDSGFTEGVPDARLKRLINFTSTALKENGATTGAALDVGCGNGILLASLPRGFDRHGVDVTEELLALARRNEVKTKTVDIDIDTLPYPDETFDVVLATDVIEHVLHTDHVLNEINRVLKPNGVFIASIPNINQPASIVMQFILDLTPMYAARYRGTHYRDFTHRLFRMMLEKHSFSIFRAEGSFVWPLGSGFFSVMLARCFPRVACQLMYAAHRKKSRRVEEGFSANMPALLNWLETQP